MDVGMGIGMGEIGGKVLPPLAPSLVSFSCQPTLFRRFALVPHRVATLLPTKLAFALAVQAPPGVSGLIIKQGEPTNGLMMVPNISPILDRFSRQLLSHQICTSKFNEPAASAFTTVYHPAPCKSSLHRCLENGRCTKSRDGKRGRIPARAREEKGREKLAIKKLAK